MENTPSPRLCWIGWPRDCVGRIGLNHYSTKYLHSPASNTATISFWIYLWILWFNLFISLLLCIIILLDDFLTAAHQVIDREVCWIPVNHRNKLEYKSTIISHQKLAPSITFFYQFKYHQTLFNSFHVKWRTETLYLIYS